MTTDLLFLTGVGMYSMRDTTRPDCFYPNQLRRNGFQDAHESHLVKNSHPMGPQREPCTVQVLIVSRFSTRTKSIFANDRRCATVMPAGPPPTTMTLKLVITIGFCNSPEENCLRASSGQWSRSRFTLNANRDPASIMKSYGIQELMGEASPYHALLCRRTG